MSILEIKAAVRRLLPDAAVSDGFLPFGIGVETEADIAPLFATLGGCPLAFEVIDGDFGEDASLPRIVSAAEKHGIPKDGDKVFGFYFGDGEHDPKESLDIAVAVKKKCGKKGFRALSPGEGGVFSTAQLYNERVPAKGSVLCLMPLPGGAKAFLRVAAVQDIGFFSDIDRLRPAVDPGKGMLPVKTALSVINIAGPEKAGLVYDPFCGVGTIPLMAAFRGFRVAASDVSPKQTERTAANLAWLAEYGRYEEARDAKVFKLDATIYRPDLPAGSVSALITEGWLGPAQREFPSPQVAETIYGKVLEKYGAAFKNIYSALAPGAAVMFAMPAFRSGKRVIRITRSQMNKARFPGLSLQLTDLSVAGEGIEELRGTGSPSVLYGRKDSFVLRDFFLFAKKG